MSEKLTACRDCAWLGSVSTEPRAILTKELAYCGFRNPTLFDWWTGDMAHSNTCPSVNRDGHCPHFKAKEKP